VADETSALLLASSFLHFLPLSTPSPLPLSRQGRGHSYDFRRYFEPDVGLGRFPLESLAFDGSVVVYGFSGPDETLALLGEVSSRPINHGKEEGGR
jgi:hypothetical protein